MKIRGVPLRAQLYLDSNSSYIVALQALIMFKQAHLFSDLAFGSGSKGDREESADSAAADRDGTPLKGNPQRVPHAAHFRPHERLDVT